MQGGQAQLGAGTVEQQTQQALNQALYNQFLQQQGYPYQVAQFLGNIAMGTGALSGSTTTTTQPSSFFSDKRLKDDIEPIGKTYDGQEIVRYRYKGEPATRIGLVAQDVEKKHPEAVGLAGGFKTVDYDKATDDAAARAPKAYGGGLNPWTDASMGGGVFREDAGKAYAAGGSPGDDILAQINALVNAHQGMFPYGKSGMYGSGMGKAGPYGSTLMSAPNRGLMRAENVGTRPVSAMEGIESTMQRAENLQKMYRGAKGGIETIREQTSLSPEYASGAQGPTQSGAPLSSPRTLADWWDSITGGGGQSSSSTVPGNARGGAIRSGLAAGGLPYSSAEDEYVPEDISAPIKPAGLQPAKPPPQGRTTGDDLMTMAKLAAMFAGGFASGGLVPRQGYRAGGDPQENVNVPEGYLDFVGQREGGNRSDATNPLFPPERGGPVGRHQFTRDTWLELARNDPRFEGKNEQEILAARTDPVVSSLYALRYGQQNAPILQRAGFDPTPQNLYLAHAQGPAGATALLQNPERNVVDVLTDVYGSRDRAMAVVNSNRGNPDMTASQFAANLTGARPQATGVAPPNAQAAATQPSGGLAAARPAEEKDWLRERLAKNEYWLVPLLTGLGTMASSPSRYLGSAILQGAMGAGQAYQGTMAAEASRAKTAEELKKLQAETRGREVSTEAVRAGIAASAYDPRTGRVRVYNRMGGFDYIPLSDYNDDPGKYSIAPYSAGELQGLALPGAGQQTQPGGQGAPGAQERPAQPGAPGSQARPATPATGAQPRQQTSATPPQISYSPEAAPIYAGTPDQLRDFMTARRREVENTPGTMARPPSDANLPTDVITPAANAANQSIQTAPRRNEFAMKLALLPETGILAPGVFAENFGQPIASWLSSILAAAGIPPRSFLPAELADANAVRDTINKLKMEYAAELQRSSGSRAFQELNSLLSAIPSGGINREAAATIMADSFTRDQRNIDFNNFVRNFMRDSGLNQNQQYYAGADLREIFSNAQDAAYVNERKFIEQMMLNKVNGKPMLNFVLESGGQLPDPVRNEMARIARSVGANPNEVMRYFRMR